MNHKAASHPLLQRANMASNTSPSWEIEEALRNVSKTASETLFDVYITYLESYRWNNISWRWSDTMLVYEETSKKSEKPEK